MAAWKGEVVMEEWRWNGSIWDFAEIVQWALVFRQLSKDKPAGWMDMVSDRAESKRIRHDASGSQQ